MGLAIVQNIANKHHGDIWAKVEAGKGASFYFSLDEQACDKSVSMIGDFL